MFPVVVYYSVCFSSFDGLCVTTIAGYDKGERDRFVPTKYVLPDADGCNGCHDGLHVHIDAHRGGT